MVPKLQYILFQLLASNATNYIFLSFYWCYDSSLLNGIITPTVNRLDLTF